MEQLRTALNSASDDDSAKGAPISDSDEAEDSDEESLSEDVSDWLIFGRDFIPESTGEEPETAEVTDVSMCSNDVVSFDGLHWENVTEIKQLPSNKMEPTSTKIKDGYHHLFTSPIDSMFAVLPYSFWELMSY